MATSKDGFERLFNKYKRYVYKICYQYTRSNEDALDLTQEIFMKVYRNIDKVNVDKDLKPWIRRISVNTCINYKRDKKEAISLESAENGQSIIDTLRESKTTESIVLSRHFGERLKTYINDLQPEIRVAVILRHFEGASYKEIANSMQRPEGTVKTYIYKGRQQLIRKLKEEEILEV